jgi:hypothetical protein
MKKFAIFLILTFLISFCISKNNKYQTKPIAFTDITVIDVTGAPAKPNMTVIISGNRISLIQEFGKTEIAKNIKIVNATGKYLIPGLWDMHVHIARNDMYFKSRDIFLSLFITNGVTGVRDCAGNLGVLKQWREDIQNGNLIGPYIAFSGPALDGPYSKRLSCLAVSDETHGRQVVDSLKKEGTDFIKVIEGLPRDTYFAIADEANKINIPYIGHIPPSVSTIEASDAGQKSIEHLWGVLLACSSSEENLTWKDKMEIVNTYDEQKASLLFQRFVQNGTWHCPTLVLGYYKRLFEGGYLYFDETDPTNDPNLKYLSSYWTEDYWPATLKGMIQRVYMYDNRTKEGAFANDRYFQKKAEITGKMHGAGVNLLAGTDCIAAPYVLPGYSLHDELNILVNLGLTTMEALQTATRNPAEFFGKLDEFGTVEKGKIADLVLLDANPLEDIRNTQKISAVVVNGRYFSRSDLDEMLNKAESASSNLK